LSRFRPSHGRNFARIFLDHYHQKGIIKIAFGLW
jgi:hypothetical protein